MNDPFFHRDEAFRLEPRSGIHHLDEFPELARGPDLLGRRLLELGQREEDFLFKVTQLHRAGRHPAAHGTLALYVFVARQVRFSPDDGISQP